MTAVHRRPASTISRPTTARIRTCASNDIDRAQQPGLADPAVSTGPATRWPLIRPAVYEPAPSAVDHATTNPSYDRGPLVEDLPDDPAARAAARLILQAIVEVLSGRRPADQLSDIATPSVTRCVRVAARTATHVWMCSLHLHQPTASAVEATAVCRADDGVRALAARVDHSRRYGWRCTAFRFL
jgi:hypothetical protein